MRRLVIVCLLGLAGALQAEPETFYRDSPEGRIRIAVEGSRVIRRWPPEKPLASDWSVPDGKAEAKRNVDENPMANGFTMKKMLLDAELQALKWIEKGPPDGVPVDVYTDIRKRCFRNPMASSFTMKQMLMESEIGSWRDLKED